MFGDVQTWYARPVFCFFYWSAAPDPHNEIWHGEPPGLNLSENKHESCKGHPSRIQSLYVLVECHCNWMEQMRWMGFIPQFKSSFDNDSIVTLCLIWRSFVWMGAGLTFYFCDLDWRTIDVGGFKFACIKITDWEIVRLLELQAFAVPSQTGLPGLHLDWPIMSWV